MTPEIPDTANGFILVLKRYANLDFALFLETSPLFRTLVKVINSTKGFSRVVRNAMTLKTKAPIIWIILPQIRKFSMEDTATLTELSTMHTTLSSKQCLIMHVKVPIKLLGTKQRKRTRYFYPGTDPIPNKQRGENPQGNWHPFFKSNLMSPINVAGKPLFSAVLKYGGKTADEVYPLIDSKCAPNALFGKCYLGDNCLRVHGLLNDSQASKLLQTLNKFIKRPAAMKTICDLKLKEKFTNVIFDSFLYFVHLSWSYL